MPNASRPPVRNFTSFLAALWHLKHSLCRSDYTVVTMAKNNFNFAVLISRQDGLGLVSKRNSKAKNKRKTTPEKVKNSILARKFSAMEGIWKTRRLLKVLEDLETWTKGRAACFRLRKCFSKLELGNPAKTGMQADKLASWRRSSHR